MAEMFVLPIRSQSLDELSRLSEELAAAHARGQSLGSRLPHIRAGSDRLRELSHRYRDAVEALDITLSQIGIHNQADESALHRFIDSLQKILDAVDRISIVSEAVITSAESDERPPANLR